MKPFEDIILDMCKYEKVQIRIAELKETINLTLAIVMDEKVAENEFFLRHDLDTNGKITEDELIDAMQEIYFMQTEEIRYTGGENGNSESLEKKKDLTEFAKTTFSLYDRNNDGIILRPEILGLKTEL